MIDANHVPPVADAELLARFITQAKQFRSSDQSVKPDLFIPFRLTELSVTRHRDATVEELWKVGRSVAAFRQQTLYGRSDVRASDCAVGGEVRCLPSSGASRRSRCSCFPTSVARR